MYLYQQRCIPQRQACVLIYNCYETSKEKNVYVIYSVSLKRNETPRVHLSGNFEPRNINQF